MASNLKIKAIRSGYKKIRNSPEVCGDLSKRARAIAGAASKSFGGMFISDVQTGPYRAVALVRAGDDEAVRANSTHNALLKSVDAGRD